LRGKKKDYLKNWEEELERARCYSKKKETAIQGVVNTPLFEDRVEGGEKRNVM